MPNSCKMFSMWKYLIGLIVLLLSTKFSASTHWDNANCSSCFPLVRPLLEYAKHWQQQDEILPKEREEHDQIQQLQSIINDIVGASTNIQLNFQLQSKLNDSEQKLTLFKELLENRDSALRHLVLKLNSCSEVPEGKLCEHYKAKLITLLKDRDTELKLKAKLIEETQKEIKNLKEQYATDSELIKNQNAQIAKYKQNYEYLAQSCPNEPTNGIHLIKVLGMAEPFLADCDSSINGTGWIVIQRRINESVSFDRTWAEYRTGFGENQGNYFMGLEKLHLMTQAQPYELYIHLQTVQGERIYARYNNFIIGNENESYELKSVGEYTGTAGDALRGHLKFIFQTRDRNTGTGCVEAHGPWWFIQDGGCGLSFLNAKHFNGSYDSIGWLHNATRISFNLVQMMIRKK